jgi:hypothetical protein
MGKWLINLDQALSRQSRPSASIKDRTVDWPVVVETLQLARVWDRVSLNPAIPYVKRQSRTGSGEMARVACTLLAQRTPGR